MCLQRGKMLSGDLSLSSDFCLTLKQTLSWAAFCLRVCLEVRAWWGMRGESTLLCFALGREVGLEFGSYTVLTGMFQVPEALFFSASFFILFFVHFPYQPQSPSRPFSRLPPWTVSTLQVEFLSASLPLSFRIIH